MSFLGWMVSQTKFTSLTLAKLCEDIGIELDAASGRLKAHKAATLIENAPCPDRQTLDTAFVMMSKEVRHFACSAGGILQPKT